MRKDTTPQPERGSGDASAPGTAHQQAQAMRNVLRRPSSEKQGGNTNPRQRNSQHEESLLEYTSKRPSSAAAVAASTNAASTSTNFRSANAASTPTPAGRSRRSRSADPPGRAEEAPRELREKNDCDAELPAVPAGPPPRTPRGTPESNHEPQMEFETQSPVAKEDVDTEDYEGREKGIDAKVHQTIARLWVLVP